MLPTHLAGTQAQGLTQDSAIAQFEIGTLRNFVYLILDWTQRKAAIVDPQRDLTPLLNAITQHQFTLEAVLLTHSHHDHVAGLSELIEKFPKLPIALHINDRHRIEKHLVKGGGFRPLSDGETFELGSLKIQILHTPGHSSGACTYLIHAERPYLLTGDTVFIRDCGRTDLETGNDAEMFASIQRIKNLAPETVILPGHHYADECASTIGRELQESPPFRCQTIEELAAL